MSELKINSLMRPFLYLYSELYSYKYLCWISEHRKKSCIGYNCAQNTHKGDRTSYYLIIVGPFLNTCYCALVLLNLGSEHQPALKLTSTTKETISPALWNYSGNTMHSAMTSLKMPEFYRIIADCFLTSWNPFHTVSVWKRSTISETAHSWLCVLTWPCHLFTKSYAFSDPFHRGILLM